MVSSTDRANVEVENLLIVFMDTELYVMVPPTHMN